MESFMNAIYSYVTNYQPLVYMLVAVALIIDGILFIIPSEKCKHMALGSLPFVAIGCGIVLLANSLATEFANAFTFSS